MGVQDWGMWGATPASEPLHLGVIGLDSLLLVGGGLTPPWAEGAGAGAQGAEVGAEAEAGGAPSGLWDQRVWQLVARIPTAQLATYGQVAELLGAWGRARQVGWALRRLPLPSAIPWHRVVNARGCIAITPSREGSDWIQRDLLLAEGIPVDAQGRLPLARFRWHPPLPLLF